MKMKNYNKLKKREGKSDLVLLTLDPGDTIGILLYVILFRFFTADEFHTTVFYEDPEEFVSLAVVSDQTHLPHFNNGHTWPLPFL